MEDLAVWMQSLTLDKTAGQISGYTASSLVLLTFMMTSMWRLRVVAIASNFAFIAYACLNGLLPILLLHGLLLPLNVMRLYQLQRKKRHEAAVSASCRLPDDARMFPSPAVSVYDPAATPGAITQLAGDPALECRGLG